MSRIFLAALLLFSGMDAMAQEDTVDGNDSSLDLVPLVDMKAPLVAVWFIADPKVPLEDASALESQVYADFFKRTDIRVMSRGKTLDMLGKAVDPGLRDCDGKERCLIEIGKALKVERVVGIIMDGKAPNYRLILKSFNLEPTPPTQLNSVVEGGLTDLLIGGAGGGVAAIFENKDQYVPVKLVKPETEKTTAPLVTAKKPVVVPTPETVATRPVPKPQPRKVTMVPASNRPEVPHVVTEPAPPKRSFLRRHMWSAITLGTSLATLGAGVTLGALGQSIADEQATQFDKDRDQRGKDYTMAANVLFGVAGATAITAVVLFFFVEDDEEEPSAVSILPNGAGLQATIRF